jgi:DNA-binding response OmpR family regulator
MGCDVDAVEHGQDAVERALEARYDLIMLDIEMPILDGVSAAQQIRANGGHQAKTPLMALSAFLADSDHTDSWRNAFDHAIPKPAGRDELRAAIQAILDHQPHSSGAAFHEPPAQQHDGLIDWPAAGEIAMHLSPAQWSEIIITAEAEIAACIAAMRDDGAQASRLAHKVKGIAASFGLSRLAQEAQRIEAKFKNRRGAARDESVRLMKLAMASTDLLRSRDGAHV